MFNFTNADNHYKEIIKCIRMGYASNPARFNSKCRLCFVFNTPICMKGIIIVSEICKLLKYNKGFTNVLITDDNSYESSIDQIEHFVDDTIDVINDQIYPLKYIAVDTQRQTPISNRKFRSFFGKSSPQKRYYSSKIEIISDSKILKIYNNLKKNINKE